MPEGTRRCQQCGGEIVGRVFASTIFCSRQCWEADRADRVRPTPAPGASCESCGTALTAQQVRHWKRFCSESCRYTVPRRSRLHG